MPEGTTFQQALGEAVGRLDYAAARSLLDEALSRPLPPAVRVQVAPLLMAFHRLDDARTQLELAVREFVQLGLPRQEARACAELGRLFHEGYCNRVAGRAWLLRAWRLVGHDPCLEQGWVAAALAACLIDDCEELLAKSRLALDIARRFGDTNLETKALADGGLALVRAGEVTEGLRWVDEAMALVSGGFASHPLAMSLACCSFYSACYEVGDIVRVEAWDRALRERGLMGAEGPPMILSTHCDSVYGTLLCNLGRWQEAEDLLERSLAGSPAVIRSVRLRVGAALADLRIRQGRLDEAEALLAGNDDYMEALVPLARLHLARGEFDLAAAVAARGLRRLGADRVRTVALLAIKADAELGNGDPAAAQATLAVLDQRVSGTELPGLAGEAALVRARVLAGAGDVDAAVATLEGGLHFLDDLDLPLLKVGFHRELARILAARDRAAAVASARVAADIEARLGSGSQSARLLAELEGVPAAAPAPCPVTVLTLAQDNGWCVLSWAGDRARLRSTKGLRYLAELVAHPGVERHAMDLVDLVEGVPEGGLDRRRLGDAGPALDAAARAAYRRRIEALRGDVEEAEGLGDDDRVARAQAEIDALAAELARGLGLGGRDRVASSAAERARLNVTRALRAAIARLGELHPEAGAALDRQVHTGLYCRYEPLPGEPLVWRAAAR